MKATTSRRIHPTHVINNSRRQHAPIARKPFTNRLGVTIPECLNHHEKHVLDSIQSRCGRARECANSSIPPVRAALVVRIVYILLLTFGNYRATVPRETRNPSLQRRPEAIPFASFVSVARNSCKNPSYSRLLYHRANREQFRPFVFNCLQTPILATPFL